MLVVVTASDTDKLIFYCQMPIKTNAVTIVQVTNLVWQTKIEPAFNRKLFLLKLDLITWKHHSMVLETFFSSEKTIEYQRKSF